MQVIGQEAICQDRHPALDGIRLQAGHVCQIIIVREINLRPPIPPLYDMMGQTGCDNTCESRHADSVRPEKGIVKELSSLSPIPL